MRYGFTGSSERVTAKQDNAFMGWVMRRDITEFHHGDCIVADEIAHNRVSLLTKAVTVVHPPENDAKRAFCASDKVREPKPYLARNRDIVDETDVLLAMPKGEEEQRSGTWSTVRYAHKRGKPVIIFWPDGTITEPHSSSVTPL